MRAYPWAFTQVHFHSASLRDCVGRVEYLAPNELDYLVRHPSQALLNRVARWRQWDQAKWTELVGLIARPRASRGR